MKANWVALGLVILCSAPAAAQVPGHPRLVLDPARVEELRAVTHPSGAWTGWTERERVCHLAYRSLVAAAEYYVTIPYAASAWRDDQAKLFLGVSTLALAHQVRKDVEPGYTGDYAAYVIGLLGWLRSQGYPMWGDDFSDLSGADALAVWALALDWLWPEVEAAGETGAFCNDLLYILRRHDDDVWVNTFQAGGWNDNTHLVHAFSGRGLAALALETHVTGDDESYRQYVLAEAVPRVRDFMDAAFQGDGAGVSGTFYSDHHFMVAAPFAVATDRLPHLGSALQVHAAELPVQQAGTWLLYEQLPGADQPRPGDENTRCNRFGATLLNDTDRPPRNLNHDLWRSWPWLLAWSTPERPSGAKALFLATYTPAEMASSLAVPFDPEAPPWDGAGLLFSWIDGEYTRRPINNLNWQRPFHFGNPVPILLGWPENSVPASAFFDAAALPPSRAFTGRGIAYFRDFLYSIDGAGNLVHNPKGTLMTFECRNPAQWSGGHWTGHAQHDVNSFMIYAVGMPLFYDSGYESYGQHTTEAHNLHTVLDGGTWRGFPGQEYRHGNFLRSVFGQGMAPSYACGDNTVAWNDWVGGIVDRSQRHFLVIPRANHPQPYVLVYDDMDFRGSESTKVRWFWHSPNRPGNADEPAFTLDALRKKATLRRNDVSRPTTVSASASARVLSPSGVTLSQSVYDPVHWAEPPHHRLTVETPSRTNADLAVLIELWENQSGGEEIVLYRPLTVTTVSAGSNRLAYKVVDGGSVDLVAIRHADDAGTWSFAFDGHTVETDAQGLVLRFEGGVAWANIVAGTMIQGTRVWFDDEYVMGTNANGGIEGVKIAAATVGAGGPWPVEMARDVWHVNAPCTMTFGPEAVAIDRSQALFYGYFVGPQIPATAWIDGVEQPVSMLSVPHPLTSEIPVAIGRSPKNDTVDPAYRYEVGVTLRDWAGNALAGYSAAWLSMEIANCAHPVPPAPPEGDADPNGRVVWHVGMNEGGGCAPASGAAVSIKIDYDANDNVPGHRPHVLRNYATISSPDEDGDGDIDDIDLQIWTNAYEHAGPIYQGDMDLDGKILIQDYVWWLAHSEAP